MNVAPRRAWLSSTAVLWLLVGVGPTVWVAHLLVSYALVPAACRAQTPVALNLVTFACAAVGALGTVWAASRLAGGAGWSLRAMSRGTELAGQSHGSGSAFTVALGALAAAYFLVVVLVTGLAPIILGACR